MHGLRVAADLTGRSKPAFYSPPAGLLESMHWAGELLFVLYLLDTYVLYLFGH